MEIAVAGSEEFVLGFRLAGIRKAVGAAPEELERAVDALLEDEDVGILVLRSDEMAGLSAGLRRRLEVVPQPVVIAVGGAEEEDLRTKVKRAIGVDLFRTT
ncbi:MAG: V-type ATP synthase subunit F [Candidatus Thermoplasmatota archaeon]|nr:V-type ATP synthase subunit F [Candidatus Thermoplasmatota archaeon]